MAKQVFRRSIDVDQLRAILDYNPYTGVFRWRYRPEMSPQWNSRFTGQTAGSSNAGGYVHIHINKIGYKAHRLAWLYMTGAWPEIIIDHIDGNGLNNTWRNLRDANHIQNTANAKRLWRHNTSGFRGVHWRSERQQWYAMIYHKNTRRYLGSFATAEEASDAYVRAAIALHGGYANRKPNLPSRSRSES
jgi:hypothetical protein